METKYKIHRILEFVLLFIVLAGFSAGNSLANEDSKYLDAVREFADNVLEHGRDTYGPKHTPLFVDGLNIHTHEPVKWIAPNGDRWILSNLASQQNLFRTLDGLTKITGDPKYRQAAVEAIEYAFANLRSPNGLFYWGMGAAYDAQADKVYVLSDFHCLKWHYPYYELMWQVNPRATKQFIDSFWSAHILNWSNLDMDRIGHFGDDLEKPWKHEYKGGPIYFQSKKPRSNTNFATGSDLCYAAAILYKLSADREPLIWCKRLGHRYVETRNPEIGISGYIYNRAREDRVQYQLGDDFKGHVVLIGTCFPGYLGWCNTKVRELSLGYLNVTPGTSYSIISAPWVCQFLLGEMLGTNGEEFTQWALEELTALGRVTYRKSDNSFIPMLIDGTSLEGYVCKKDGFVGLKGTMFKSIEAIPMDFWAYALAYRITADRFMWEIARYIALGQELGEIGISPTDNPKLQEDSNCSDPFALVAFLELYKKTGNEAFLRMAERIGDNILANRYHKGFFTGSARHIYTKFDAFEPLALLHLHATTGATGHPVPQIWPSRALFTGGPYRGRLWATDYTTIYALTDSPEPPQSLEEAVATGDVEKVRLLISQGADVDDLSEDLFITPLHRAAMMGYKNVVELLLTKGANIDARDISTKTALHFAAERGHREIAELLIVKGADVNVKNMFGDPPLQYAARYEHRDIIELLLEKGATISTIHLAAYMGDLAKLEAFIQEGVDINSLDDHGYAPLQYAAQNGQKEAAELLITKGADVNAKNNDGQTPLDIAVTNNRKDIIDLLVEKGADLSLHVAVSIGDPAIVQRLIESGADVNAKKADGDMPLHSAVGAGHKDIVELLIAKGADVNTKNNNGETPLNLAVRWSRKEIVELLLAKGADITFHAAAYLGDLTSVQRFVSNGVDVNIKDAIEKAPLHYAVQRGHKDIAEFLLSNGADINAKNNQGQTPLGIAASRDRKDIIELLVEKGADISLHVAASIGDPAIVQRLIESGADVNAKDKFGCTPLYYAIWKQDKDTVKLLVTKGADVSFTPERNYPALHYAVWFEDADMVKLLVANGAKFDVKDQGGWTASAGHREVIELLIAKGANVDEKGINGQTPLYRAAQQGHGDVVEVLVAKGANIDAKARSDQTALHLAAVMGRKDMAALLIVQGADLDSQDVNGQTPLHLSARQGRRDTAELLITKGADVNAKNKRGRTPLDLAVSRGHTEIVELLRKHGAKE